MNTDDIMRLIAPSLRKLAFRLNGLITRGELSRLAEGQSAPRAQGEGLFEEVVEDAELWQRYGFASEPGKGEEALFVAVCGDRGHRIVLSRDSRHRPSGLKSGDVAVYDKRGNIVKLSDGGVSITLATSAKLKIGADASDKPLLHDALKSALANWTPVPNDGGESLKTLLMAALNDGSLAAKKTTTE